MEVVEQFYCHEDLNRNYFKNKEIVFLCIGTDRSTGDSLGPLVGTMLKEMGYDVIGTLDDPTHALNLQERTAAIPKGKTIIAIDACLGKVDNIGKIKFGIGGLKPGAGVNKDLGTVGDYFITGTVNVGGFMEYFVLQNTRLGLVMKMARRIAYEIRKLIPVLEIAIARGD